jgi:hypothetical protein
MAEFGVFVKKQGGVIDRAALVAFYQANQKKMSDDLGATIQGLDSNVKVTLQPLAGGVEYLPLPRPRAAGARWSAVTGSRPADLGWGKVEAFLDMLEGLEKIFESGKTGAFEVPAHRAPDQNGRFTFATGKFVEDHVASITSTTGPKLVEESAATAKRRMTRPSAMGPPTRNGDRPLEFTNITTSSTMDLHQPKRREELKDEIDARQKEFEAIYKHLTSAGMREQILLQGEHEEVIFTSQKKFNFYEAVRPGDPAETPIVTKYAENHLRYAVQKVGERWLLHHMAGRAAPDAVATAPTAAYQAFNYGPLGITAVPGTFSKIQ